MGETVLTKEMAFKGLKILHWEEGKVYSFIEGPYRHAIAIICSSLGRQKAIFAGGEEHNYFAFLTIGSGRTGANIVPVIPNGKLLMVIEQRPAQGRASDRPQPYIDGKRFDLSRYGTYSSLEFPGGAIEPDESVTIGALRELLEETGLTNQSAQFFRTLSPQFIFGSDVTSANFYGVVFLSKNAYNRWTANDGGLYILTIEPAEVLRNIQIGAIVSVQAGLMPWFFYEKVMTMRNGEPNGWDTLITEEGIKIK